MPGTFLIIPGVGTGITDAEASIPALPYDVADPGSSRSINVTETPDLCNQIAVETPTIPAPMTKMSDVSLNARTVSKLIYLQYKTHSENK